MAAPRGRATPRRLPATPRCGGSSWAREIAPCLRSGLGFAPGSQALVPTPETGGFMTNTTRRGVLAGAAALLAAPAIVRAQAGPIRIGSLTPLTGGGGSYGPPMRDAIVGVINEVNQAGGVLGRQIQVVSEDDQTNPEAAVRAARKLIDVD